MATPKRPPVFREDGTIEIHLTKGFVAVIDGQDAHLGAHNWCASGSDEKGWYGYNAELGYLHRAVLGLRRGRVPEVDHRDGDTMNCRRENLREVTTGENQHNSSLAAHNTSGFRGICRSRGQWMARLDRKFLGRFETVEEAQRARLAAEEEKWGVQPRRAAAFEK